MSVRASPTRATRKQAAPEEIESEAGVLTGLTDGAGKAEVLARRLHRLALDVHDGPMQNLTAIGFSLGDLRRTILGFAPSEHRSGLEAGLDQIADELGKVESELRLLVNALEDGGIKSIPLRDAIEYEIAEFERRSKVRVAFIFDDDARAETDSQRIALQSVTRAALANVAKHSSASRVTVRLNSAGESTTLEIEDNGEGFRANAPLKQGRMGLAGMRQRVELLGGEFQIKSRQGGPTIVTASLRAWRPDHD
jgi:signal transduction histidine kinase